MKKKLSVLAALSGVAVACAYRAIKGYGIFNRIKFSNEHSAVSHYVEQNHPGATYSSIQQVGESFTTIIDEGTRKLLLTVTPAGDGVYVFSEENLTFTS
ncbi:MAG: hypothetical protein UIM24_05315 [Clostridia bacterium]|nr:hypothetical protein [Clostridia bacterium]